jgi:CubicO group peptidase (beta-lactamase class C family)
LVDDKKHYGHHFGILEKQGKYDIHKPAPIMEWQQDKRKNITTNDLLHMNSGLEWEENYSTICDATTMLFQSGNMEEYN